MASDKKTKLAKHTGHPAGQMLIYHDGSLHLQVRLEGETVWLPQRPMAELFQVSVKTANEHLVNIFSEGELDPEATIRKFRIVQREGNREVARMVDHYNRDSILAVGYRVWSLRGTQFRQWATQRLPEPVPPSDFDRLVEKARKTRARLAPPSKAKAGAQKKR